MKILIIYDSVYGNTQKIAEATGAALAGDARVTRVDQVSPTGLEPVDLLIIGSPTLGGRATQPVQDFLAKLPDAAVKGMRFASFDTRLTGRFVKMFGYAAEKIAESLQSRGAVQVGAPEPFYVTGKKGPLKEGEAERAASWAKSLTSK